MGEALTMRSATSAQPALAAELVGVASAGKTTLLRALAGNSQIRPSVPLGKHDYLLPLLRIGTTLLPTYLAHHRHSRWFTKDELRGLIYLQAWHTALRRRPEYGTITVFDHGPIFRLALLRAYGPAITAGLAYRRWEQSLLDQWAATLAMVIWLDAPDALLIERINRRDRQHAVKYRPAAEVQAFLARYRVAYDELIAQMSLRHGLRIVRFDTSMARPEQIAAQVLAAFDDCFA